MGKLVDMGPKPAELESGAGNALTMTFDPQNTAILYVGYERQIGGSPSNGLWKSTDGGSTWKLMGMSDPDPYDCRSNYLDLPVNIAVDPNDSRHIYVTEGVRGAGNGFWVTWDGGETWTRAYSEDLTALAVDPCDFCHVLVGSHGTSPVGVLESKDGGYSFYSGSGTGPIRSSDNGKTWMRSGEGLSPGGVTYGIIGDGSALYAMVDNAPPPQPLMTSPEDDGQNWAPYGSGDLAAPRGMQQPHFDAVSNILYFVNNTSLMAIRVR